MNNQPLLMPSDNFAGLEEEYSNFKRSKVVIMKVPFEKTTTYVQGTKEGPNAIIQASKNMETFDDELNQETYKIGIHTVELFGVGELESQAMVERVHDGTQEIVKAGKFPVMLGGEHSISQGAVKACKEAYPDLSVLQLDAHHDLYDQYQSSPYNHACSARRISEICPVVQVGGRNISREEKDFLNAQTPDKIRSINVYDILEMPLWKDAAINSLTEHVYVTIDLDVLDPAIMPAVGTPEPGGLGWYEVLDFLKELSKDRKIVGFDVVELCPVKGSVNSDFLASKLVYRLIGYIFGIKK